LLRCARNDGERAWSWERSEHVDLVSSRHRAEADLRAHGVAHAALFGSLAAKTTRTATSISWRNRAGPKNSGQVSIRQCLCRRRRP